MYAGHRGGKMHVRRQKILGIGSAAIVVVLGAALAAANLCPRARATVREQVVAQSGWRLGPPISYANLTIFPVVTSQDADTSGFMTLDQALASGDAVVTEEGADFRRAREGAMPPNYSGAQVNQLVFINRGKRPIILLAGEVVSGGHQDRIISKDRILPAGGPPLPLDVFCVEHGRWTGASEQFVAAQTMVHPSVRENAAVEQDQNKVWAAVRGDAAADSVGSGRGVGVGGASESVTVEAAPAAISAGSLSQVITREAPTQSYQKIYKSSPIGTSVESFADEIQRRFDRENGSLKGERVVGVVVAFGGEVAWSDIFASSDLFNAYWPKLLRSYVVEAMTRPGIRQAASLDDARDFLRPATGHIEEESEPGIYRWRKQSEGRLAEIELDAVAPKPLTLHYLRVLHGDTPMQIGVVY
jgi:hypothetical protein